MKNKKAIIASAIAALTICGAASAASYNAGLQNSKPEVKTEVKTVYVRQEPKIKEIPVYDETAYNDGYSAGLQAGKNDGYNAGFYDGEQAVITGMIIETDGDCDGVLIYYRGDCYLHGANGFPIDVDEPLTACYQID